MKNLFKYMAAGMIILATSTSCEDNENWVKLPTPPKSGAAELYVVGAHQGWKPDAEVIGKVYSADNDGIYTGYVFLNGEFKCCSEQNWDGTNYGFKDGAVSVDPEAGNMTAEEGYYWLTLDTNTLTYSVEKREWGVIGDATPGGWDTDVDLVYDPTDLKLKANITMTDGTFKFRANDGWDFNLGGELEKLIDNGDNINVKAGEYQVILDLSTPDYKAELLQ